MLVPLDEMSELNGGTAVAVGSHADPAGCDPDRSLVVYPNVAPGSVLVLHPQVLHGGGPNRLMEPRRVMVVQFGVHGSQLLHRAAERHALWSFSALTALARSSCTR
jgi:ectoine hydroxylase-related dioxygenase (phytanoyl-CoA dioxygenase family)